MAISVNSVFCDACIYLYQFTIPHNATNTSADQLWSANQTHLRTDSITRTKHICGPTLERERDIGADTYSIANRVFAFPPKYTFCRNTLSAGNTLSIEFPLFIPPRFAEWNHPPPSPSMARCKQVAVKNASSKKSSDASDLRPTTGGKCVIAAARPKM